MKTLPIPYSYCERRVRVPKIGFTRKSTNEQTVLFGDVNLENEK